MCYSFALLIALFLLIPTTFAHQSYPIPHAQRGLPVPSTCTSHYLSTSVLRRAAKPASSSPSVAYMTVQYHNAENYALRELAHARAIARSPQAHVRSAEIWTCAASAYEFGRAYVESCILIPGMLTLRDRAEEFRADIMRQNPAIADYGHLHALDWIEMNILAPASELWRRWFWGN